MYSSVFNSLTDFGLFLCMCCRRQDFVHQDVGGNSVPSVQATKSGAALKAVPKQSKHLVAYMEGLLAVSPYVNGPFDSHAKGVAVVAEAVAAAALSDLKHLANGLYIDYLKHKFGEWYREPARGPKTRPQATRGRRGRARASRRGPGGGNRGRCSFSWRRRRWIRTRLVKRIDPPAEFDVRGAPERAPDRDRAVPGLHSAVFGSRPQ